MARQALTTMGQWGLSTEEFFYFFMGLRKGEIRKQVQMMKARFPDDDPAPAGEAFCCRPDPALTAGRCTDVSADAGSCAWSSLEAGRHCHGIFRHDPP